MLVRIKMSTETDNVCESAVKNAKGSYDSVKQRLFSQKEKTKALPAASG